MEERRTKRRRRRRRTRKNNIAIIIAIIIILAFIFAVIRVADAVSSAGKDYVLGTNTSETAPNPKAIPHAKNIAN